MTPTVEQLADAIYRISDEEPLETEIPQDVLDKLAELGMVNLEVDSAPTLTEHGERTYVAIEAGDDIPEFDDDLPDEG
jgi:Mn-dependent DtxR family transcriptional regulator